LPVTGLGGRCNGYPMSPKLLGRELVAPKMAASIHEWQRKPRERGAGYEASSHHNRETAQGSHETVQHLQATASSTRSSKSFFSPLSVLTGMAPCCCFGSGGGTCNPGPSDPPGLPVTAASCGLDGEALTEFRTPSWIWRSTKSAEAMAEVMRVRKRKVR